MIPTGIKPWYRRNEPCGVGLGYELKFHWWYLLVYAVMFGMCGGLFYAAGHPQPANQSHQVLPPPTAAELDHEN